MKEKQLPQKNSPKTVLIRKGSIVVSINKVELPAMILDGWVEEPKEVKENK